MAEEWDLYDENRQKLGSTMHRGERVPAGAYHLAVRIFCLSADGRLLITQRHPDKTWPLTWEGTGGAVQAGENTVQAALREVREEIGVTVTESQLEKLATFYGTNWMMDCFRVLPPVCLDKLTLQKEEVVDARLVTDAEFVRMGETGLVSGQVMKHYLAVREKLYNGHKMFTKE